MCVRVCVSLRSYDSVEELQNVFLTRKMIFDQSFTQKILFRRGDIYLKNKYIYIPPLSRPIFVSTARFGSFGT